MCIFIKYLHEVGCLNTFPAALISLTNTFSGANPIAITFLLADPSSGALVRRPLPWSFRWLLLVLSSPANSDSKGCCGSLFHHRRLSFPGCSNSILPETRASFPAAYCSCSSLPHAPVRCSSVSWKATAGSLLFSGFVTYRETSFLGCLPFTGKLSWLLLDLWSCSDWTRASYAIFSF